VLVKADCPRCPEASMVAAAPVDGGNSRSVRFAPAGYTVGTPFSAAFVVVAGKRVR